MLYLYQCIPAHVVSQAATYRAPGALVVVGQCTVYFCHQVYDPGVLLLDTSCVVVGVAWIGQVTCGVGSQCFCHAAYPTSMYTRMVTASSAAAGAVALSSAANAWLLAQTVARHGNIRRASRRRCWWGGSTLSSELWHLYAMDDVHLFTQRECGI